MAHTLSGYTDERALAHLIACELRRGEWKHGAVYDNQLKRFWPPNEENREAKIAQFARKYGSRVRFYREGFCAIFDKEPAIRHQVHQT